MGKTKAAGKKKAPRCPVDGCKFTLVGENYKPCGVCGVVVCATHQFPADHDCKTKEKKKAAASGGLVFVTGNNNSSNNEAETKDPAQDEQLVKDLLQATPQDLLKELIEFGSATQKYPKSLVVKSLCSEAKPVKSSFFGAVLTGIIEAATNAGEVDLVAGLLKTQLEAASQAKKQSSSEERRSMGTATVYGRFLQQQQERKEDVLTDAVSLCKRSSEKVSKVIASEVLMPALQARVDDGQVSALIERECQAALAAGEEDDRVRCGAAFVVASAMAVVGPAMCGQQVADAISGALKRPKETGPILGALRVAMQCCKDAGTSFTPFLVRAEWLEMVLNKVADKVAQPARSPLKKTMISMVDRLDDRGARLCIPQLMQGLDSPSWRAKALALQLLGALGKRQAAQMFRELPVIVPAVMECVKDTKKQVAEAAEGALDAVGSMITNSETRNLMPWLLAALKSPDKTEECLDELMDTTFVNSVDAQSLALIIPIVLRGLREGSADMKLKAATTTGNVCSLVADVHDMRPFYGLLVPELKKLQEHSSPRVRELALAAKQSLQEDMAMTRRRSSHQAGDDTSVDGGVTEFLDTQLDAALSSMQAALGPLLTGFLRESAHLSLLDLLEDVDENMPRNLVEKQVAQISGSSYKALLAGSKSADRATLDAVSGQIAKSLVDALWMAQGKSLADENNKQGSGEKEYLVYLPSIILAFASRLLLKRTGLFLEPGKRYAVVGMNGVGKTTLLNRIAARDINGFPDDVSCYYVQHEIMEEDAELTVTGYMHRDLDEIVNSARKPTKKEKAAAAETRRQKVAESLDLVGFSDELRSKPVASLSGGWRMRLAIARSMLYGAELLLLDEPTNHLDASALDWLRDYLRGLKDTTIMLVSHDYEFVDYVCTDIIHLADLKLQFYPYGFKRFQEDRPEVVAALPKKDKGSGGGGDDENNVNTLELLAAAAQGDEAASALASKIKPIKFPEGCKLSGVANRGRPISTFKNVAFAYPGTDKQILKGVTTTLTLNSRVVLLGKNGAGKSTLLKLLVGELELDDDNKMDAGKIWKHHNLRIAYIAQHSMHHLEDSIEMTPCSYIQKRFWEGQDREASKIITTKLTPEDEEIMTQTGEISAIASRVVRSKKLFYEVIKNGKVVSKKGFKEDSNVKDFRSLEQLEQLGKTKPHVMKLVRLYDEKLKMEEAGIDLRPLTTPELIKHLAEFGIPSDIAQRKIRWMSGGQKSRLCLAAAAWTRPHVIICDEPTNYLDNETLAALTYALKTFRGGVLLISHHSDFVDAIAKQTWSLDDGVVTVQDVAKTTPTPSPAPTPPLPE